MCVQWNMHIDLYHPCASLKPPFGGKVSSLDNEGQSPRKVVCMAIPVVLRLFFISCIAMIESKQLKGKDHHYNVVHLCTGMCDEDTRAD